jgi:formamidopyrimidine-DNA glycosylase
MPELPEVETLKLGLQKYLVGHRIEAVEVKIPKILQGERSEVVGARVTDIKRVGKGLIIELDNGFDLVVHLKMTGQLIFRDKSTSSFPLSPKAGGVLPGKHSHVIFNLDPSTGSGQVPAHLYFNDLRQFGYIKIIKKEEVKTLPFFKEMGPEPFARPDFGQKMLGLEDFNSILSKSGLAIKVLLMDQKKIGGIGNIYANEALFKAGINPQRKAKEVSGEEAKALYKAIFEVIDKGLAFGGSSDENFVNVLGQDGEYQQHFVAYGQQGKRCSICGGKIEKTFLGGRGTYFCPAHQR